MKLDTFHGVLLAFVLIIIAWNALAYVAPCVDNYGACPL